MKKNLLPILLLPVLAVGFFAGTWYTRRTIPPTSPADKKVLYYVDPMHPAYKSSQPGTAPDCGMQLEAVYAEGAAPSTGVDNGNSSQAAGAIKISAEKQQLFGVRVGQAEKAAGSHTLRLFGRVAPDEARVYRVNSGVDGIMQQTSAVTTGSQVSKDQVLAEFSSPDFLPAMQSYLFTVNTLEQVKAGGGANEAQLEVNNSNTNQTYDRLQAMGMAKLQIEELARAHRLARTIKIYSPADGFVLARNVSPGQRFDKGMEWYRIADLSKVWIQADVPGSQAQYIRPGMRAQATLVDQKRTVTATVSQVLPSFDASTRTLKVRFEADNPGFALRPDMLVDVELSITLPSTVTVPAEAVLDSGLRKTVFVDRGAGSFEPRQVETGWRLGDRVEIAKGLEPGERIVTSGTFLLDSESRMKQAAEPTMAAAPLKDPVCGMELHTANTGHEIERAGKVYHFCSTQCQGKFVKEPGLYVDQAASGQRASARPRS